MKRLVVIGLALLCMGQRPTEPIDATTWVPDSGVFTKPQEREIRKILNRQWQQNLVLWERLRSTDSVLTAARRVDTDTIKNESANFLMVMPENGVVSVRPFASVVPYATFGQIRLYENKENGTGYVGLKGQASLATAGISWSLPDGDGTNGQVMETDASGNLYWVSNYNWSKTGDTLFQHVFDTVAGATESFTLPIAYTSTTSYRVTCSVTDDAAPNINRSDNATSNNVWGMVRVRNTSASTFTVQIVGYTDASSTAWSVDETDSVTCNCVASGR